MENKYYLIVSTEISGSKHEALFPTVKEALETANALIKHPERSCPVIIDIKGAGGIDLQFVSESTVSKFVGFRRTKFNSFDFLAKHCDPSHYYLVDNMPEMAEK